MHLNVGQNITINTSSVFMSIEKLTIQALPRRTIRQSENAHIQLPHTIHINVTDGSSISLRVRCISSLSPLLVACINRCVL